ncbi:MAG: hypothetical protein GTO13_02940 [Proteobacteria bacterium]|nr:hypothetical protein [Pseudomonadota bacterium]
MTVNSGEWVVKGEFDIIFSNEKSAGEAMAFPSPYGANTDITDRFSTKILSTISF